MQTKISQMYGSNKLRSEIESKKAIGQAERQKKEERRKLKIDFPKPQKLVSGGRIGLLELVKKDFHRGYFGPVSRGKWVVRCVCGRCKGTKEWVETYKRLVRGTAYSCGKVARPRKQPTSTRPPNRMAGEIGRLTVIRYVTNRGWECRCRACRLIEWVRYSRDLGRAGRRKCANV